MQRPENTSESPLQAAELREALKSLGIGDPAAIHHNLGTDDLYAHARRRNEIAESAAGSMIAITVPHTGRSPNDKFIIRDATTEATVDWGKVNQPMTQASFLRLKRRVTETLEGQEIFVQELFAGADASARLPIRILTTTAWHSLFARNMFIRPDRTPAAAQTRPAFTLLHLPAFRADPQSDGTRSDVFVIINFAERLALIGGTSYAGEIKKTIFTVMNYLLPEAGILPMHASANEGRDGEVAIFFGLSGTGKTTLSADSTRTLIGDDEHGWGSTSIFNFEGGCYAKAIRLDPTTEPEIYAASNRYGTILENVVMDPKTRRVDFSDPRLTENTRSSYPIDFIPNASKTGQGGLPKNIVMLTCDAHGVLPPISKLTPAQAMYHFLSGYTARIAGTEKGVTEPEATFSACFGAPFMPRPATFYAHLLGEKINRHRVDCWLVNTGWTGGGPGKGQRMPIPVTRALLRSVLSGTLAQASFEDDGSFGLQIPKSCEAVDGRLLNPRSTWDDRVAYDRTAAKVKSLFRANFEKFQHQVAEDVRAAGIDA